MDKIMGPLLTWLSRQEVEIGRSSAHEGKPIRLGWAANGVSESIDDGSQQRLLAGRDWRLLGTYNPQDAQRVFRFGQALSRRFVIIPVPAIRPGQFAQLLATASPDLAEPAADAIGSFYSAHLADPVTALGPAVFLGMARYVQSAMPGTGLAGDPAEATAAAPDTLDDGDVAPSPEQVDGVLQELLAEAYVLGVGRYIAGFEDRTFDALGVRIVEDETALSAEQWRWLRTQRDILS